MVESASHSKELIELREGGSLQILKTTCGIDFLFSSLRATCSEQGIDQIHDIWLNFADKQYIVKEVLYTVQTADYLISEFVNRFVELGFDVISLMRNQSGNEKYKDYDYATSVNSFPFWTDKSKVHNVFLTFKEEMNWDLVCYILSKGDTSSGSLNLVLDAFKGAMCPRV